MKRVLLVVVCGLSLLAPSMSQAYSWPGYRWGVGMIGFDTSGLGSSAWRTIATTAMSNWNSAGAKLQMVNYAGSKNTMSNYWENSDVLAYNQTSRQYIFWGDIYRSQIHVNTYHRFNPPYGSGEWYDLTSVLRHELGHTVPLNHVSNQAALMYPSFGPSQVKYLSADEVNGIRAIYGIR